MKKMSDWKEIISERDTLNKKSQPKWIKPMLATLTEKRFSRESWLFERKLDGERCLAFKKRKNVKLKSRNKKSLNKNYPEIESALEDIPANDFILDGEIVAFSGNLTDFSRLQDRMHVSSKKEARKTHIKVYYYVFDILYYDGYDLRKLPLRTRKKILKKVVGFKNPLRFVKHRNKEGKRFYKNACSNGWEGLIAKDAQSRYKGTRSKKWLKFKCVNQQELVIVGFTNPEGERKGFGALLVGYYKKNKLRYAGKIGTGYDEKTLNTLSKKLKKIEIDEKKFEGKVSKRKNAHWVKPKVVCEVEFTEWTENNKLRHPVFKGLRRDKNPKEVVKESGK